MFRTGESTGSIDDDASGDSAPMGSVPVRTDAVGCVPPVVTGAARCGAPVGAFCMSIVPVNGEPPGGPGPLRRWRGHLCRGAHLRHRVADRVVHDRRHVEVRFRRGGDRGLQRGPERAASRGRSTGFCATARSSSASTCGASVQPEARRARRARLRLDRLEEPVREVHRGPHLVARHDLEEHESERIDVGPRPDLSDLRRELLGRAVRRASRSGRPRPSRRSGGRRSTRRRGSSRARNRAPSCGRLRACA